MRHVKNSTTSYSPRQDRQTAPLQADYRAFLAAPNDSVFDTITNCERLCQFVSNLKQVTVCQSAQGLIRTCDFGNDMIVEERIVFWQPPHAYAYSVVASNPFGLRQHYAIVSSKPRENGTQLRWQHYFEHDDLTAMLSMLNRMFDQVFFGLFEEFGGHKLNEY
ncbi:SRPBCC family protein [Chloroflexi bacterium TSY]|nr:SRPBCC family protein [Chloroflexi bacterium TSY]